VLAKAAPLVGGPGWAGVPLSRAARGSLALTLAGL